MKKILVFAAAALVAMSMISCGGDRLAARHEVVLADTTGTILPFIKNFDEEILCFKKVIARDYQKMIRAIGKYEEQGISRASAELEAFRELTNSAV